MTPSERVEQALRAMLADMAAGDPLPPVRVIAADQGVSVATVSKALRRLREDGVIGSRPGWATYKL